MKETYNYKAKLEKDFDLKIFTDNIDFPCLEQTEQLMKANIYEGPVRLMPDCHAGKGAVVGFTAKLGEKVIPNVVGADIGCGMLVVKFGDIHLDLETIDKRIREDIPCGMEMYDTAVERFPDLKRMNFLNNSEYFIQQTGRMRGYKTLIPEKFEKQIGTLGGGNHFIEFDIDDENCTYLVIHTGSRNLGNQVAEYYQNLAYAQCKGRENYLKERETVINTYKTNGKQKEIKNKLAELEKEYKEKEADLPKELCYLTGAFKDSYIHDMEICQNYATLNRETIAKRIIKIINEVMNYNIDLNQCGHFHTVHNYIDFKDNVIRKGAIRATNGTQVIIPMNMRDGSLICVGKGNIDWNLSAPHGAGRIMSRSQAKQNVNLDDFIDSMKGIYTTSVNQSTIDESPFVYKPMEEIIENIKDTVDIVKIIKPIYNFKASKHEV